jgi:hypothetical protein
VIDGTGNKTTTSTSFVVIDNTNLPALSVVMNVGDSADLTLAGQTYQSSSNLVCFDWQVVQPTLGTTRVNSTTDNGATVMQGTTRVPLSVRSTFVAAEAGTHTFQPVWKITSSGTATLSNATTGNDDTSILHKVQVVGVPPYVSIQDQKTQNTAGGTFTSGSWQTRTLNTEVTDTASIASIASNQITLPAGTYRIRATAPAFKTDAHQTRLWNATDSSLLLTGTTEISAASDGTQTRSEVSGRFTLSGTKAIELQHQCATTGTTTGFGSAANFTTEVYSSVELWKES